MTGLLADTRAYYYLPPLTRNPRLDAAARAHGADMARNNFFGHASTNGDHVTQRVAKAGYSACLAAENLGWGKVHADPQTMMTGWLNSPGHRSNLLHPRATEFGLARAADTDGSHDPLWVLVIGRPGC
ncbi:CAP domain-containing protein [Loktanella sp. DJP18]|uniref:CAP domain-containing protein n=1 Tax=Loktanella sp. DJP18 TaxID=3409788 RepID=UPI003BB6AA57